MVVVVPHKQVAAHICELYYEVKGSVPTHVVYELNCYLPLCYMYRMEYLHKRFYLARLRISLLWTLTSYPIKIGLIF